MSQESFSKVQDFCNNHPDYPAYHAANEEMWKKAAEEKGMELKEWLNKIDQCIEIKDFTSLL